MGAALGAILAARAEGAAPRPNLLFILADDLGYGDLGCYGQKRFETPNLDRLAREGMRFTQFYAGAPVCAPSRCVLLTGLHTGHATVRGNRGTTLQPDDVTVGEALRAAGYRTAVIGKWGMGDAGSTGVPGRQGFERFFGYLGHTHAHNYFPEYLWRSEGAGGEPRRVPLPNTVPDAKPNGAGVATERRAYSHDRFTDEALRFLDESAVRTDKRPFFLYLGYTIPHANNEAGKRGMEVPELGAYADRDWPDAQKAQAAMIARMDRDVGRLLEKLKALGLDRNTLVVFSSDNGPHREGGNDPDFADSNGPLRGIKRDLYEGGIRVPFLARWPGHVPAGVVSSHVGYFADVLPTLSELAGARPPAAIDGISVAPTLLGRNAQQKRHAHLYWEFYERGGARAVRMDDWKGICPQWHAPPELYDLSKDPGESRNVAAANPEVVAKIRTVMARQHTPSPRWKVPPRPADSG